MPVLDAAFALENGGGVALDLKGKGVSRVDPSLARGCPNLGKLDLGDNVVSDRASIAAIAECEQLKWLSLANCGLGGAGLAPCAEGQAREVGGGGGENERPDKRHRGKHQKKGRKAMGGKACRMPNMRVLNISGNELESLQGVNGMANLGALIANENRVESMEPLSGMTRLNTVVLSSNRVETIGEELTGMTELNKLSLSHNRIEKIGKHIGECVALKELRLAHNPDLKTLPPALGKCAHLRVLDLSHCAVANFGDVSAIKELTNLAQLSMRGCPIANEPSYARTLVKMCPSLRAVDGRRVGPGGFLDPEKPEKDGGIEKKDAPAARKTPWERMETNDAGGDEDDEEEEDGDGEEEPEPEPERKKSKKEGKKESEGVSFIEEMVAVNRGKLRGETAQDERGETKATRSGVVKIVEVKSSRENRGKAVAAGREALIMAASGGRGGDDAGGWDDLGGWGDEAPTTGGWDEPERAEKSEEEGDDEEPAPTKKKKKKRKAEEDGRGEPEPEAADAKKKKKMKKKSLDGKKLKAETPDSLGRKRKKKKVLFFD